MQNGDNMKIKPIKVYFDKGVKITVYDYIKPSRIERTFPAVKGSVANLGAKAVSLSSTGLLKRKHG